MTGEPTTSVLDLRVCLEDVRSARDVDFAFMLIELSKAAVVARGGKVVDISYSNEPHQAMNPCGTIGTLSFKVWMPFTCHSLNLRVETVLCSSKPISGVVLDLDYS